MPISFITGLLATCIGETARVEIKLSFAVRATVGGVSTARDWRRADVDGEHLGVVETVFKCRSRGHRDFLMPSPSRKARQDENKEDRSPSPRLSRDLDLSRSFLVLQQSIAPPLADVHGCAWGRAERLEESGADKKWRNCGADKKWRTIFFLI